jgi:hypothetical protein
VKLPGAVTVRFFSVLAVLCLLATSAAAQVRYFPNGSLSADTEDDKFVAKWFSEQLAALKEPSLWESSKTEQRQSYRFLWLRTFHHPIAVRIDVNADGTSSLTTKMTSGEGAYRPGKLIKDITVKLTKERTDSFLGKIQEYKFWQLPSEESPEALGADGAQWIVEGVKHRSYHVVNRWSPKDGDVRAIGLLMINDLANLKIEPTEVY